MNDDQTDPSPEPRASSYSWYVLLILVLVYVLNFIDRHRGRGHVPTLCDAPQLKPYGACRVCSVEIAQSADGPRREHPVG